VFSRQATNLGPFRIFVKHWNIVSDTPNAAKNELHIKASSIVLSQSLKRQQTALSLHNNDTSFYIPNLQELNITLIRNVLLAEVVRVQLHDYVVCRSLESKHRIGKDIPVVRVHSPLGLKYVEPSPIYDKAYLGDSEHCSVTLQFPNDLYLHSFTMLFDSSTASNDT
jgi:hypothetical protein